MHVANGQLKMGPAVLGTARGKADRHCSKELMA